MRRSAFILASQIPRQQVHINNSLGEVCSAWSETKLKLMKMTVSASADKNRRLTGLAFDFLFVLERITRAAHPLCAAVMRHIDAIARQISATRPA